MYFQLAILLPYLFCMTVGKGYFIHFCIDQVAFSRLFIGASRSIVFIIVCMD